MGVPAGGHGSHSSSTYRPALVVHSSPLTATSPSIELRFLSITRTENPEPLQKRMERRSFHTEPCGGSPRATNHPVRLVENSCDEGALHAFERLGFVGNRARRGLHWPRRQGQA